MKIKNQIIEKGYTIKDFHTSMYVEYMKNYVIRTGMIFKIQQRKEIIHIKRLYHNPDKVKIKNIIKIVEE